MYPIDGLQLLSEIKKISPEIVAVIITAHGSVDTAVQAIKQGAYDYLQKPFDFQELQHFAQKVYDYFKLQKQIKNLQTSTSRVSSSGEHYHCKYPNAFPTQSREGSCRYEYKRV